MQVKGSGPFAAGLMLQKHTRQTSFTPRFFSACHGPPANQKRCLGVQHGFNLQATRDLRSCGFGGQLPTCALLITWSASGQTTARGHLAAPEVSRNVADIRHRPVKVVCARAAASCPAGHAAFAAQPPPRFPAPHCSVTSGCGRRVGPTCWPCFVCRSLCSSPLRLLFVAPHVTHSHRPAGHTRCEFG